MIDTSFRTDMHHILGGDNSLDALAEDLIDFVRWNISHISKKRLEYDKKKYTLYYMWMYDEIADWFKAQRREFRYPVFLTDTQSTIAVKVSVGRDVRSNRKSHDSANLLSTVGNERGSHTTRKLGDGTRLHIIYINAYGLSFDNLMDVRAFIQSEFFEQEMRGTVKHEFMHVFDTYFIKGYERAQITRMKKIYKKYRAENNVKKQTVTLEAFGHWVGNSYTVNTDYITKENNLRDFYYMLPYYFSKTEMNAYLQTFSNQISVTSNEYDSAIYKRYIAIKKILQEKFDAECVGRLLDERFITDFGTAFPKLKAVFKGSEPYAGLCAFFLEILEKYLHKMHKILFDFKSLR